MSAVGTADAPRARTIRAFAGVPMAVPAMIAAAWVLAVVAEVNGAAFVRNSVRSAAEGTSHAGQSPITFFCPLHLAAAGGSGVHVGPGNTHAGSFWLAFALFLIAWQTMIVAMMLPSSLPLVRLFSVASAGAPARGRALLAFLSGYALVWTAFGARGVRRRRARSPSDRRQRGATRAPIDDRRRGARARGRCSVHALEGSLPHRMQAPRCVPACATTAAAPAAASCSDAGTASSVWAAVGRSCSSCSSPESPT